MNPNSKEIKCIQFTRQFYPSSQKPSFFQRLIGKKEEEISASDYPVSEMKRFYQLWDYYVLNDGFSHRESFAGTDKLQCLSFWVKVLYDAEIDIEELRKKVVDERGREMSRAREINKKMG
jgi:hypothetical protein